MDKVIIATDSSAYLPKKYVDQYHIPVLPLTVNWEGKSYLDGVDIQAEEFYQQLANQKHGDDQPGDRWAIPGGLWKINGCWKASALPRDFHRHLCHDQLSVPSPS